MKNKGPATRQEIVEKALQLFSVKGYHNTSVNDLCEAAGLTKGGLYGHFESKEEVWKAAHQRAIEIWRGIVFRGTREIADPLLRVRRAIRQDLLDYLGGGVFAGGCFFLNLLVELSGQTPQLAACVLDGFDGFSRLLARWLAEAREKHLLRPEADPEEIAAFLVVTLNGAAALFAARRERSLLEMTVRQLDAYLDSWRARAGAAA